MGTAQFATFFGKVKVMGEFFRVTRLSAWGYLSCVAAALILAFVAVCLAAEQQTETKPEKVKPKSQPSEPAAKPSENVVLGVCRQPNRHR
jgi:hypothetical protein